LTKNKPITDNHLKEFLELYETRTTTDHSWTVSASELQTDYDLSAKNPAKQVEVEHLTPTEILADIQSTQIQSAELIAELETLIKGA
jgi:type I restriction enzyme M protein